MENSWMETADKMQTSPQTASNHSLQSYQTLVNQVEAILWEADANTFQTIFVNAYAERLLGYSQLAWMQDTTFWSDHIHPEDRFWVLEHCRRCIEAQEPFVLEYRMIALNGRFIWLRDNFTLQQLPGSPPRLYSVKTDISNHKQTEHLLNRQNMVLHMLNSTPHDVALYESERTAREQAEVLREFAHIVGSSLNPQEVLQRSLQQLRRVLVFDTASIYLDTQEVNGEFMAGIGYHDVQLTTTEAQHLLRTSPLLNRMSQNLQPLLCSDVRYLEGWIWIAGATHVRSFMAAPLVSREGTMIGALMMDSDRIGFFAESDLQLVEVLAQHLSTSIENAWLFEQSQRQLAEKTALLEVSTAVSSSLDLMNVLTHLAEQMTKAIGVTSAYIVDWNAETKLSTVLAEYYAPEASTVERVSDLGVVYDVERDFGFAYEHLSSHDVFIFQLDDPQLNLQIKEHLQAYGAHSILHIPLIVKDTILGHAELWESRRRYDFKTAEIELVQGIARQAAIAMSNAQLFQAEARRRREAEILKEVSSYLTSTLDLDEVLNRVVEAVHQYVNNIENCSISILENGGQFLRTRAAWFDTPQHSLGGVGEGAWIKDTLYSREALETRKPVMIADTRSVHYTHPRYQWVMTHGFRSLLYVPLLVQDEAIGILHVSGWQPHQFTPEETVFCQGVAAQAAIAIQNARLFEMERRQLRLSSTLQQVGSILTTSLRLDEVYNQLFDLLNQVIDYDCVSIQLVNESDDRLELAACRGFSPEELASLNLEIIKSSLLARVNQPPYWAVIGYTQRSQEWVTAPFVNQVASWIGSALMVKGRLIGVLNLDSKTAGIYTAEMAEMVAVFANQAAVAIENARLYNEISRRVNELEILHQVAMETAVALDVDQLLQKTTETIAATLYPHVFGFVLVDDVSGELRTHTSYHGVDKILTLKATPMGASVVGRVVQTGLPLIIADVSQEKHYFAGNPETRSEIAVPLKVGTKIVGVVNVESPQLNTFNNRDAQFLSTLAGQVAGAIERARLYEALRGQAVQLTKQVTLRTAELQTERDRTLTILESAGEGIILTDLEAHILYINPAMERITGYSRAELVGLNPRILGSGQTSRLVYQELWKNLTQGQRWSGEVINRRKDGVLYDAALTVTPITNQFQEVTGYVSVQSDISRLKELDRLKTKFVSNVSHELRTPLTNIKTYITLLERGREEKRERYLQVLHQETDRLTRLIQDLLNISRLDSQPLPEQIEPLDPRQLIKDVFDTFTAKAEARQIHFRESLPAHLPSVRMERRHLEQLMTNLLGNAFAYTVKGGAIAIEAGHPDEGQGLIWVRVSDNGSGIPPEDMPRLFDRFFRGQTAVDSGVSGTGLGLAICKEIVDRYKGKIEVESMPGAGSRFTIWLPTVT